MVPRKLWQYSKVVFVIVLDYTLVIVMEVQISKSLIKMILPKIIIMQQ